MLCNKQGLVQVCFTGLILMPRPEGQWFPGAWEGSFTSLSLDLGPTCCPSSGQGACTHVAEEKGDDRAK